MDINDSENNLQIMFKNIYIKFLALYLFYFFNLITTVILINIFKDLSCIPFNFLIYVDLFLKTLIIIQIIYVYRKRIHNINYIFLWKYCTGVFFITYPLVLFIIESQKGWNGVCKQYNILSIYCCLFASVFFFIIFKTGNRNLFIQENDECVVCLDNISLLDKVKIDSCGHLFHRSCILTWFTFNYTCPTCRIRCSPSDLRSP